jgi:hypothetical protein
MLIIGNRDKSETIGPLKSRQCERCRNHAPVELRAVNTQLTVFFAPLFAYQTEHYLTCPVCGERTRISPESFEKLRPLAELNQAFAKGTIKEADYKARLRRLPG